MTESEPNKGKTTASKYKPERIDFTNLSKGGDQYSLEEERKYFSGDLLKEEDYEKAIEEVKADINRLSEKTEEITKILENVLSEVE